MSKPLEVGDILYYPPFNEHLLLIERAVSEDHDGTMNPAWEFLILETNKYSWYWEVVLEDPNEYMRAA